MKSKQLGEVNALTKIYDLLLWIIPLLEKFPKSQRFLLGDKIEGLLMDTMEEVIQAVYTRDKVSYLKSANINIEKLRHFIRLVKDLRYINTNKYEYSSRCLNEIGAEIGGWIKYTKSR